MLIRLRSAELCVHTAISEPSGSVEYQEMLVARVAHFVVRDFRHEDDVVGFGDMQLRRMRALRSAALAITSGLAVMDASGGGAVWPVDMLTQARATAGTMAQAAGPAAAQCRCQHGVTILVAGRISIAANSPQRAVWQGQRSRRCRHHRETFLRLSNN